MLISPHDIKTKALKLWRTHAFHKSWLLNEQMFPYSVSFRKPPIKMFIKQITTIREWLEELKSHSKEVRGFGYTIEYAAINHRKLGEQKLLAKIIIESEEDYLALIDKEEAFDDFKMLATETMERIPKLKELLVNNPSLLLKYNREWHQILTVCEYLINNPNPDIYIRQMNIPGIDTKFIESYKKIVRDMLDILFSDTDNNNVTLLTQHGFERRYGLKYDEPLIRFRLLDTHMHIRGMTDISIPLSEFNLLTLNPKNVFITENKINGLTFPPVDNSIVIFGLGYGIQFLKDATWLKNTNIYYWGDVDTHSFKILSQVRTLFNQCVSLLMDRETLLQFRDLWTTEVTRKRHTGILENLTHEEILLYNDLQTNTLGENIRLEQERIAYQYVCNIITTTINSNLLEKFP